MLYFYLNFWATLFAVGIYVIDDFVIRREDILEGTLKFLKTAVCCHFGILLLECCTFGTQGKHLAITEYARTLTACQAGIIEFPLRRLPRLKKPRIKHQLSQRNDQMIRLIQCL